MESIILACHWGPISGQPFSLSEISEGRNTGGGKAGARSVMWQESAQQAARTRRCVTNLVSRCTGVNRGMEHEPRMAVETRVSPHRQGPAPSGYRRTVEKEIVSHSPRLRYEMGEPLGTSPPEQITTPE